MKILDAGRTVVPWWVNQVVSCPHCQRTMQLEGNDFEHPELQIGNDAFSRAVRDRRSHRSTNTA